MCNLFDIVNILLRIAVFLVQMKSADHKLRICAVQLIIPVEDVDDALVGTAGNQGMMVSLCDHKILLVVKGIRGKSLPRLFQQSPVASCRVFRPGHSGKQEKLVINLIITGDKDALLQGQKLLVNSDIFSMPSVRW